MTERKTALEQWLRETCELDFPCLQPMPHDASFRRYYRFFSSQSSFVAMDAKPPQENCQPYRAIDICLYNKGINVPKIFYSDLERGFLVLTDFGDTTYLRALNAANADALYVRALNALTQLQACRQIPEHTLALFDASFMRQEWAWHKEWFLQKLLNLSLETQEKNLNACYDAIIQSAVEQPQVFMHRDYHSANLMVLPQEKVGILDFQDAFIGPVTYDLVSLLRDCYIAWPESNVRTWVIYYYQQLCEQKVLSHITQDTFLRWFDLMGVERHLKALFTFARKYLRDQQTRYLKHIPRTVNYILETSARYPELTVLQRFFATEVKPALQGINELCAR